MIEDLENREFSPEVRRKILIACLFALMVGNMMI
jgi:MFS family permease